MQIFDLCFAWNWKYDFDFAQILTETCKDHDISLLEVTSENLEVTLQGLKDKRLGFRAFFDRASDEEQCFSCLAEWARSTNVLRINRFRKARRAWDKAAMHTRLSMAGLDVPLTLTLPAFNSKPDLPCPDLSLLGERFAIKPAHGGGGKGVVLEATCWEQVLAARQQYPADQYLLQAHLIPATLGEKPGWFRVLNCTGLVFPFWWDPHLHTYQPISEEEQNLFGLYPLFSITEQIARISQLELFSTEIAFTPDGCFMIVDYVNDPIDLRLKSKTPEGVPDDTVEKIARAIVDFVLNDSRRVKVFPSNPMLERSRVFERSNASPYPGNRTSQTLESQGRRNLFGRRP